MKPCEECGQYQHVLGPCIKTITITSLVDELLSRLRPDEFCSCEHRLAELIPAARMAMCRSCGRPIRGSRNNTKEKHS